MFSGLFPIHKIFIIRAMPEQDRPSQDAFNFSRPGERVGREEMLNVLPIVKLPPSLAPRVRPKSRSGRSAHNYDAPSVKRAQ